MTNYLFFWSEKTKTGHFSNFYPCKFIVNNLEYNCSEQYFMKKKQELFDTDNEILAKKIMNEINPKNIKKYGRSVKNYDDEIWNKYRYKVMLDGVYAKFSQNPELKIKLLQTYNIVLVEASPYDKIWGIGFGAKDALLNINNWGTNLLGKVLMEVREKLKT